MVIRRFNAVTRRYFDAKIQKDWNVTTSMPKDNKQINCVHCGQPIKYEESFESMRYKDERNKGYRECKTCYNNYLPIANFSD